MKIGWDCDGVFYDFAVSMGDYLVDIGRLTREDINLSNQQAWSLSKAWDLDDEEFDLLFAQGVDDGVIFRHGVPALGSVEVVRRLKAAGHTNHFVTARLAGTKFAHNTLDWFHDNEIPYDSITFSHDKTIMAGLDLLVDDHVRNYDECTAAGMHVVLLDQPWNREYKDAPRVTWETVEDYIKQFDYALSA